MRCQKCKTGDPYAHLSRNEVYMTAATNIVCVEIIRN